jgi:signal transduction histidine kinase
MLKNENLIRVLIHDIGNPLSGVIFGIDRISKQYSLKEEIQSSKIKMVQEGCDKILEIINFIKDIKSLESGKKQLALTKIDLFPIIEKLKEDFSHQLRSKKLQLDTSYSKKPIYAYAERISLTNSILSNLLSNAIKFSHFNSSIKINCFTMGNRTLISIKNFDAVIESSNFQKIFDPFKATTTQGLGGEEGTGFGLPIVKMFTHYNNGEIKVNSTENETEFLLYLQNEKDL